MAHQLIGFYSVADDADGHLKVMRSYQYYAANKISDIVANMDWTNPKIRAGYIWHTTGSGKTITLKVMAESFSDAGVPVFLADVKGDLAGCALAGEDSESLSARLSIFLKPKH